jgi:hypothetical protein
VVVPAHASIDTGTLASSGSASAEAGGADLLITTDDRMMRRAVRAKLDLRVRRVTPPEAATRLRIATPMM